jgi:hypothetical protein
MLIVGTRPNTKLLGQIAYICPSCQHNSWHSVGRTRRWFTLFFIPVIPFTKSSISRCNLCGFMQRVPNPQAEQWFHTGQAPAGLIPQLQPGYVPQGAAQPAQRALPPRQPSAPRQPGPYQPPYPSSQQTLRPPQTYNAGPPQQPPRRSR